MKSLSHRQIKELLQLHQRSGRAEQGSFLVEGEKGVQEAKEAGWPIERLIMNASFAQKHAEFLDKQEPYVVDDLVMKQLSQVTTPPGVLAQVRLPQRGREELIPHQSILALVDINDPGNLGTMIRTAEWFGIQNILITEQTVDPYNDKVVRSSMGSIFRVKIYESQDLLKDFQWLKATGYQIIATSAKGGSQVVPRSPFCLLMGNESHGLAPHYQEQSDLLLTIPRKGQAESLNVAVSCGILLYTLTNAYD